MMLSFIQFITEEDDRPFLRPAVKYKGRVHEAEYGEKHSDIRNRVGIPHPGLFGSKHNENGFVNHLGDFMDINDATDYGIHTGIFKPKYPGQPIISPDLYESEEALRNWMGNSHVVDDKGNPLKVYHGTRSDFDTFSKDHIGSATDEGHLGRGFYFSTDPKVVGNKSVSMPVYLKAENPLHISMPSWHADKRKLISGMTDDHDSVILDYSGLGYNHKEIMVREPYQIKSAIGNNGRYDPNDPSIIREAQDYGSLPFPSQMNYPRAPSKEQMDQYSRVEDVPLDKVRRTQSRMYWDDHETDHQNGTSSALIDGYGDLPVASKLENGEYLLHDGHHRATKKSALGAYSMPMHVIDARNHDPENMGRKSQPSNSKWDISDQELLDQLQEGRLIPAIRYEGKVYSRPDVPYQMHGTIAHHYGIDFDKSEHGYTDPDKGKNNFMNRSLGLLYARKHGLLTHDYPDATELDTFSLKQLEDQL